MPAFAPITGGSGPVGFADEGLIFQIDLNLIYFEFQIVKFTN